MKPRLVTLVSAHPDSAAMLAEIHATSFADPWSEPDFAIFLRQPGVSGWVAGRDAVADGFILVRRAGEEAEILTLAVQPARRREGLARALLDHAMEELRGRGIAACFLEVATDNVAARALYEGAGFVACGTRRKYYELENGGRGDATVMRRDL